MLKPILVFSLGFGQAEQKLAPVVDGGGWVVCKPILVFSFDFGQAEQFTKAGGLMKLIIYIFHSSFTSNDI